MCGISGIFEFERREAFPEEVVHRMNETIVHREGPRALPHWLESMFAFMQRNSVHVSDFFRLPPNAVVEIGRQISV